MRNRTAGTITLLLSIIVFTNHFAVFDADRNCLTLAIIYAVLLTGLLHFLKSFSFSISSRRIGAFERRHIHYVKCQGSRQG